MYAVFPVPRQTSLLPGKSDLSNSRWIRLDPVFSDVLRLHLDTLARNASTQFQHEIAVTVDVPTEGDIFLSVRKIPSGIGPEGYRLSCEGQGFRLKASTEAGVFYGLQTLKQILVQAGEKIAPFAIEDSPDFAHRGFMLDVSRCKVPTMENLFRLVDTLAALKFNQLQLYIEHTFAYAAHETVWRDASPLTGPEIKELDAYCRDRFVELVPNQNSFGHFERWLRHPEYQALAECPDGLTLPWDPSQHSPWGSVLKPDEESIHFLDGLYSELLPHFISNNLNAGCDETWELGRGWSKEQCDAKGVHRVFFEHLLRIQRLIQTHGHRMMFWADIILQEPSMVGQLPADVTALNWGYEADHPFENETQVLAAAGIPFYVCPGTSSWNSCTGRTTNAVANCRHAAVHGLERGANGYLLTDWGDNGHHQPWTSSIPGLLAGAGCAWCLARNENADLPAAADRLIFHDQNRVLGNLCYNLGRVHETIPGRIHNNSPLHLLLFKDNPLADTPEMNASHLKKCLSQLDELRALIPNGQPAAADGETVKAELNHAIALAHCACRRGLLLLHDQAAPSPADLSVEYKSLIERHREIWLLRNRSGGREESLDHFRKRVYELKD